MLIETKIQEISEKMKLWDENLEQPAKSEQITSFCKSVFDKFNIVLPNDYLAFLALTNGLEFNGVIIYGTENSQDPNASPLDLIAINLATNTLGNAIILGETSTELITFDSLLLEYQLRDRIGLDRIEPYSGFEQVFYHVIDRVL
ncbi:TPA: YrhA family protein [Photobacterium damselae]